MRKHRTNDKTSGCPGGLWARVSAGRGDLALPADGGVAQVVTAELLPTGSPRAPVDVTRCLVPQPRS